jgi:hypothetical protein
MELVHLLILFSHWIMDTTGAFIGEELPGCEDDHSLPSILRSRTCVCGGVPPLCLLHTFVAWRLGTGANVYVYLKRKKSLKGTRLPTVEQFERGRQLVI